MSEEIVNAIIAGIGSADTATEQAIQIIKNLNRAGCGPVRIEALGALLRMHRCLADSAMSVEKCVDGGWCGCSAGLLLQEPRP